MNNLKKFFLVFLLVVIASCSNNLKTEGNFVFPNKIDKLYTGLSKDEVIDLLGPATVKANFNENTWYYIYEISVKRLRFLEKTVTDSKVIILDFNENKLKNIKIIDYKDRKNIPMDYTQTKNTLIKTKSNSSKFKEIDAF